LILDPLNHNFLPLAQVQVTKDIQVLCLNQFCGHLILTTELKVSAFYRSPASPGYCFLPEILATVEIVAAVPAIDFLTQRDPFTG
jgi:hypothetical protein